MTNPTSEAYGELQSAFQHYNDALFSGRVPHCLITMQRKDRTYGYFSPKRFTHKDGAAMSDEIAINPSHFMVVPLLEILQTIVHEMAHAWQLHFGRPGRRGYHNKEWADKMEEIGLMPSSTGEPGGLRTGERMADYPIEGGHFMRATDALMAQGFGITWLDQIPPKQKINVGVNRSNRLKYRCPSCDAQAWGKPGLSLLCGNFTCKGSPLKTVAPKSLVFPENTPET